MNFISAVIRVLISFCYIVHTLQSYKSDGLVKILYTFSNGCLWTKLGFKTLFKTP